MGFHKAGVISSLQMDSFFVASILQDLSPKVTRTPTVTSEAINSLQLSSSMT